MNNVLLKFITLFQRYFIQNEIFETELSLKYGFVLIFVYCS